mmetsp:Transcript_62054/g.69470  ORF Transcript_62054/g.69470 Transcript_62054/m.69470 type:complete len:95 (-) Transcript_62054:47-331(-)
MELKIRFLHSAMLRSAQALQTLHPHSTRAATQTSNSISFQKGGTSMVACRILFNDGDDDVVVSPLILHSIPTTTTTTSHPHHEYSMERNEVNVE